MTYRFCFGASGSGKSTCLHQEIIQRSMRSMESGDNTQYLVLVPEQYSMQTQKEMIMEHEGNDHGTSGPCHHEYRCAQSGQTFPQNI